ncbi:MFS transporter [Acidiferrimicrobium sp. IK]|uniref:MFS transporter n=1 Tax=Acidiferrimicrobium sp. IK TaxID=2871700 RepID=UPI0021CB273E|nr:MFS transporter [Acidiferrimicrobium sp. IK]MCU4183355.1 MFS transporter [Acidiferrimicrobium sp. IK]
MTITGPAAPAAPPRTHYQVTFGVLSVAVAAYALLQSLVIPVLPTIQAGLHTSQNTVTWVLTAYLLSASIFTPIMGRLGDMLGKERMLVVALIALTLGSVLSAVAGSVTVMLVGRVIQGVGGGVLPLSFGLIRDEFPGEKVSGAVGVIAALASAGAGLGIVLAGPIVAALDYHWLFWIPAGVLAVAALAAHLVVPESRIRTPGQLNWSAAALLSAWLVALILGISEAPTWGWASGKVIGLLIGAVALAGAWVIVESRSPQPLIDMRMMRIPAVWTTNLVALLLGIGMYAVFAFLPEFLQTPPSAGYGFGVSITVSGLILLPSSVFMFAFGVLSGRLSRRWGARMLLVVGLLVSIITFVLLTVARAQEWEILLAMVIQGVGFGMAYASMSALVVEGVPASQTGVASGMNANIRTIGGSIGAAVMGSIVTASAHHGGLPSNSGYTAGFAFLTLAAVAAAVAAWFVPRSRRPTTRPGDHAATMLHAELGMVAAGTLAGDESE